MTNNSPINKVMFAFGTRPEAIKMAPLIKTFQADKDFVTKIGINLTFVRCTDSGKFLIAR